MAEKSKIYPVSAEARGHAHIDSERYLEMYRRSLEDSDAFWAEQAETFLAWSRKWDKVQEWDYRDAGIKWFLNGRLNVAANCLDRHLAASADRVAIIWQGEQEEKQRLLTFRELHEEVCRFANALKARGVGKGDRVSIYMPMVPEVAVAMLACARIGAVHSVVFGGFSAEALRDRILDSGCRVVITVDECQRGGRKLPFKQKVDQAVASCPDVHTVFVARLSGGRIDWQEQRDVWYREAVQAAAADCPPEEMDSEDPLFVLYTSGSTGKPKGVLHTTGGYLLYAAMTHKYVFDYHPGDIYWCTADVGWVTGHSYAIYGPLCNGATTLMFEGLPTYPHPGRFWELVEKYRVNIFYTAPTLIRSLMQAGDDHVKRCDRSSLRVLGTVGEPINREAWEWYYHVVGEGRCPIMDTWWQTETGGILITPLPGVTALKPGSASQPFFGVEPALLDVEGREITEPNVKGNLVMKRSWPGQMRTVYGDHRRFVETYFSAYPGYYFSGDGATRDEDGYYWITGRVDDVINVSGHRLGTAEVESALGQHHAVAESAVVACPHRLKGQGIYAYVTLKAGHEATDDLRRELVAKVREIIGPVATPDRIQWAPGLPKTRSGKIMRRILRKIAADETGNLGDITTLADPAVVEQLIENRQTD
ncbi:MAG: acetate--CoA ligase [Gammaproteobacteria bacterium]|nr:acetate--CoA ligase [Gammaproteobacteria bacterium]